MPLHIIRNDITKVSCDAIVNAANTGLLGGGGVDGAIHRAAGPGLLRECRTLGGCPTGQAKITKGYRLPCRYVIHTPGPVWRGGSYGERELLISCYRNSLLLAQEHQCKSIAFPLISAGVYGYPKDQALQIAADTISTFLAEEAPDMQAYLVVFDKSSFLISEQQYTDILSFIDDHYVDEALSKESFSRCIEHNTAAEIPEPDNSVLNERTETSPLSAPAYPTVLSDLSKTSRKRKSLFPEKKANQTAERSLNDEHPELSRMLQSIDESFSEMLLRKIDEKHMKDSECYKRANIDRKLFSKIRSDRLYKPSKSTALAFAVALELPLEETNDLLRKAGFALSHSNKSDIIIEYFITHRIYDILTINEALFSFDQKLLGA